MGTDLQDGVDERTVLPPSDMAAMLRLATFLKQHSQPAGLVGPDGQQVPLPLEVFEVLVQVVGAMSDVLAYRQRRRQERRARLADLTQQAVRTACTRCRRRITPQH